MSGIRGRVRVSPTVLQSLLGLIPRNINEENKIKKKILIKISKIPPNELPEFLNKYKNNIKPRINIIIQKFEERLKELNPNSIIKMNEINKNGKKIIIENQKKDKEKNKIIRFIKRLLILKEFRDKWYNNN
jgi:hypothetical protein